MKQIILNTGVSCLVDDNNYEWLNKWKWTEHKCNHTSYAVRNYRRNKKDNTIFMHRLILGLQSGDDKDVDHINHNGLDNKVNNLRSVTRSQNHHNGQFTKGYSWHKWGKKWQARIMINYKTKYLGYFDTEEDARQAYLNAKLNFIQGD